MLSVPTLWIVFTVNFLALGVVWTYVARSYPNLEAARFWAAATFIAAGGAAVSILRSFIDPHATGLLLVPLLLGGVTMIVAICVAAMGVERFYGRPLSWRAMALTVVFSLVGLAWFAVLQDNIPTRIVIYSAGQSVPLALTLPLLFSRHEGRSNPGARLAGCIAIGMLAIYAVRSGAAVLNKGGVVSLVEFNPLQAWFVVMLVFLSMMWNFGFLLMAIDRLRAEVADLAMLDDLTGAANRRRLLARLDEECARSHRTLQPFTLLVIDLDDFKGINDSHGHAAGDECLRLFTRVAQDRLRAGDLLARMGGDEFCIVLPSTTLREGATVARQVLDACRMQTLEWNGVTLPLSASIGVAQWRPEIGLHAARLMAAADRALYTAKQDGRNGYAVFDVTPLDRGPVLRRSA
jgi:diguanylate cyclase (GGDEF)-like protein